MRLRRGPVSVPLGERFRKLAPGTVLQIGVGRYRLVRPEFRSVRLASRISPLRLLLPLGLAFAMLPFAIGGPPWRWLMVLLPLLGAAASLAGTSSRAVAVRRGEDPLGIWIASTEGRAFATEPVLPRRPRALRRGSLAGTGWAVRDEGAARWLAGYLAVHNDPAVLRVTSPWLQTDLPDDDALTVRFESHPSRGPGPREAIVTWGGGAPGWAVRLRARRRASEAWLRSLHLNHAAGGLPGMVGLAEPTPAELRRGWTTRRLAVAIGQDEDGQVVLDLAAEGPHLLVAGTTGAGKSEFLTTFLLALAAANSPENLHLILVDFKGGAAFGPLTGLPHCVGLLTDLDRGAAERALGSLRAQLQRREQILADAGCRDITDLDAAQPGRLPRLVVVVDEFRAFADDHPDLLDHIQRLAAQGRSLGVHLVLATQRPAGAVPADLRANLAARLCLRVAETADSSELIGDSAAARLPPTPGRAILVTSRRRTVQVAWAGNQEAVARRVRVIAGAWDGPLPAPPWLPELPARLEAADLPLGVFGLADLPELLRQEPVPVPERLLVAGPRGSGRTEAARTIAAAALHRGDECWVITASPWTWPEDAHGWGGFIHPRQLRLIAHLLTHVSGSGRPTTLVLDDLEAWSATEDAVRGPGAGSAALTGLLRTPRPGLRIVACSGPDQVTSRWAASIPDRFLLAGCDIGTAALAGVPRGLAPLLSPPRPGRGILLPQGLAVQVAMGAAPPRGVPARRFVPLPAGQPEAEDAGGTIVVGADDGGPVRIDAAEDVVVIGRPGAERDGAAAAVREGPGARVVVSPGQWATTYGGELGRIKDSATLLVVRPDLGAPHGVDLGDELEPGSLHYAVLVREGTARALRLARYSSARNSRGPK